MKLTTCITVYWTFVCNEHHLRFPGIKFSVISLFTVMMAAVINTFLWIA